MPAIPLITSLPPRMSRPLPDGREFGAEYQAMCIASWREAGFSEIVSVNSRRELEALPQIYDLAKANGVRVVAVERDAAETVGKAYAYVSDIFGVGAELAGDGTVAFVNADIMLGASPRVADLVAANVGPGQFAVARRVPVDRPGAATGEPYYWGFDFFAGDAREFAAVPDIGLIVGCHWWDHLMPALMCWAGARMVHIEEPVVIHLEHEERSGEDIRARLGQRFLDELRRVAAGGTWKSETAALYMQGLERAVKDQSGRPIRDLAAALRRRLPTYAKTEQHYMLHRLAMHCVSFIDSYKTSSNPTNIQNRAERAF